MDDFSEVPDIRFFGLVVRGGERSTYQIDNEPGIMEIGHLTNCALCSESASSSKPIFVRIKSPDETREFVLGALVPGKIFSFTTDLLITPDTSFTHTGSPKDEVHLTGYRSINADAMLMEEDDAEDVEGVLDEEDDDVIQDDDEDDTDDSGAESDEDTERGEPEISEEGLQKSIKAKVEMRNQRQDLIAMRELSKAGRADSSEDEDVEDDEYDDVNDDDESEDATDLSKQIEELVNEPSGMSVDSDDADEESSGGEDIEADPSAKAQEIQQAQVHKKAIEREKKLQHKQQSKPSKTESAKRPAEFPQQVPVKRVKQEDVQYPSHPDHVKESTKQYAQQVFDFIKRRGSEQPMNLVSSSCKRPEGADKIGKMLAKYTTWFRRKPATAGKGEVIELL